MSRHRDVRNLDYDELLDDEAATNEMSPEESDRLDAAVDAITARIGDSFSLKEVQDSAWYYYFDVDQATNWLLEQRTRRDEKLTKSNGAQKPGMSSPELVEESIGPSVLQTERSTGPELIVDAKAKAKSSQASTEDGDAQSPQFGIAPQKKLTKLQQLAKDKAAAKKATQTTSQLDRPSKLASSLARLRKEPEKQSEKNATGPSLPIEALDAAQPSAGASASTSDQEYANTALHTLQEALSAVKLADPSNFALTMLGPSHSSSSKLEDVADRDFFSYTAAPQEKLVSVKESFARPSPDDVVQKAQAASKGMIKSKINHGTRVEDNQGADNVAPLPVKKANVARQGRPQTSTSRRNVSLVVVGHVDAGKSTLFGRLLYDLGNIDERSMQKLKKDSERMQKSSFAFAWAMDSSSEERERGVTIDFATNSFETERTHFTILDAPGHKDFVPNMIAGASQADFAIIVIDASIGAFESGFDASGQTKEHAVLVRSLGIQNVLVAVNKLDNVDWSERRFRDIEVQMGTFLKHTGFDDSQISFVPCSGLSGDNVVANLKDKDAAQWYKGRALLGEMESVQVNVKDETGPFRMIVGDIQSTTNSSNITVTGRIAAGELRRDDTILCMPSKESATIKALDTDGNTEVAFAGDNVTLVLSNIEEIHLRVGDVLCHELSACSNVTRFKARMVTFQMLRPLLTGSSVTLHRGRADMPAIINSIQVADKSKPGVFKSARHVVGNCQAMMTIELIRGILPLETFTSSKELGRIILRREGDTVAAGVVVELL